MAMRNRRTVVQSARLRDQVYDLIREAMRAGEIEPRERLFEVALAKQFNVSRTPVREALFQLAREGLLVSKERGYTLPADTPQDFGHRLEVHALLDPCVARYAAHDGTDEEIQEISQALKRAQQAHKSNKHLAFGHAFYQFRMAVANICPNVPLKRCVTMVEDRYIAARNEYFKDSENRQMALSYADRVLAAIQARDAGAAEQETRTFIESLIAKRDAIFMKRSAIQPRPEPARKRIPMESDYRTSASGRGR